jgi:sulfur relay (sulfurtransferase) DsrC/TusE family protein
VTHANVALRDCVISLEHGMASGCPATAVANSVYNLAVCFYSAGKIIQEADNITFAKALQKVRDVVRPVTYGDDSVIAVNVDAPYDFNQFSAKMNTIGMTYTSEDKTGPARLKPLEEATFLKRGFKIQWGAFRLGHIEKQTIHELFFWHRDHLDHDTQIVTNIENGLRELAMWNDQEEYDRVVRIVRKYCVQFRLQPRIQTMLRNIEEAMGMQTAYYQCSPPVRCPCPHGSMCLYGCPQCAEDEEHQEQEEAMSAMPVHPGGRRFWNEVDPWLHGSEEFRAVMIEVIEECNAFEPTLMRRLRNNVRNGRNLDSVFNYRERALCHDDFPRLRIIEKNVLVERDFQKYATHFYLCLNESDRACVVFRTFPVFGSIAEMEQE